jgi:hypothetical protein
LIGVEAVCEAGKGAGLLDKAGGMGRLGLDNAVKRRMDLDSLVAGGRNWRSVYV